MQRSADRTSPASEVAVVLATAFGFLILTSLAAAVAGRYASPARFDDAGAAGLIVYEIAALAIVGTYLRSHGWTLRDVNPEITWRLTGAGFLLCGATLALWWTVSVLFAAVGLVRPEANPVVDASGLGVVQLAVFCVVNPVFEETLVVAYVVEALRNRHPPLAAVNVSVSIRMLYHLYQGPAGVIAIVPMGLLFAFVYLKWNRLWPLVFAHGLLDAAALASCR